MITIYIIVLDALDTSWTVTVRRTSLSELIIQAANSSKSTCACREVQSSRPRWVRATCITAAPRTPCHGRGHAGIAAHPAALVVVYLRPTFVHLFVRHLDLVGIKEGSDLLLGEVVVVTARACTTKDSVPLRADACRTRTEIGGAGLVGRHTAAGGSRGTPAWGSYDRQRVRLELVAGPVASL